MLRREREKPADPLQAQGRNGKWRGGGGKGANRRIKIVETGAVAQGEWRLQRGVEAIAAGVRRQRCEVRCSDPVDADLRREGGRIDVAPEPGGAEAGQRIIG